ncbi:MAG: NmrA family NAD(P)-binding protein [Halioglobus sp.]|nr:NmrA family NAD(P)-binding protein [Halioglobus sp.]
MLVITGPNGNVGTELVRAVLRQPVLPHRIASRHPQKLREQFGPRANCQMFDFDDRKTWAATLRGADTVFLLFPLPHPKAVRTRMLPFIDACAGAGVEHIIYVSVPAAEKHRVVPHHGVEMALRKSGIDYTILQASYFCQNMCRDISSHGVDIAVHNEIFIPAGSGRTSFIDSRDVAEVALAVAHNPASHRNRRYVLTGPQALDFYQVAQLFSEVLGRPIRYVNPTPYAFWQRLKKRGVTWDTLFFMSIVYSLTRYGKNALLTGELEPLLGRPPTTMRQFIEDYRERWEPRATEAQAMVRVQTPGLGL